MTNRARRAALLLLWATLGASACLSRRPGDAELHGWWQGLGPVVPHDTFPADCSLCHAGEGWDHLREDFAFDHGAETGVELLGAHVEARCLRCHNDRGPVRVFQDRGCAGCHEDQHLGTLGPDCSQCHQQRTWVPVGQVERHQRTRFPLTGAHATVSCRQCHPSAELGIFVPLDTACVACHLTDLGQAQNPNHANLGWVDQCNRCHRPTTWNEAVLDPNF